MLAPRASYDKKTLPRQVIPLARAIGQHFRRALHIEKFDMRATTAQLYPGRDTFEFSQRHMTKNQSITVLILLSESLAI